MSWIGVPNITTATLWSVYNRAEVSLPRHEFMNIRSLGRECQQGLHVNIPIDTERTVNQLPRNFTQSQTIQLQLFRKLSYSKPYLYETIRPKAVLAAARYLSTTKLFKQQNVVLSEEWNNSIT